MPTPHFWEALDTLVSRSEIVIDRPRGTAHPRYPGFLYPLDYGYLQGTMSGDGSGIDVWMGSQSTRQVTALLITVDGQKRDAEIKLLFDCTPEERQAILALHDQSSWSGSQSALLIQRASR
ncbi:MAG TPA: inorganic pyrophosphatase [Ktedonobacteraceae bacterium]|nr:inorganic pyrophosphatase [Ktedonobacteraceae bacterium]